MKNSNFLRYAKLINTNNKGKTDSMKLYLLSIALRRKNYE